MHITWLSRWLGGAYFMLVTMLSIGYGDITPQSLTEIIIVMFCMIAGIIFFGILLGSIADALTVIPCSSIFCQNIAEQVLGIALQCCMQWWKYGAAGLHCLITTGVLA